MTEKEFIKMIQEEMREVYCCSSKYMFYEDFEESDPDKHELYRDLYNYYIGKYALLKKLLRKIEEADTADGDEVNDNENN